MNWVEMLKMDWFVNKYLTIDKDATRIKQKECGWFKKIGSLKKNKDSYLPKVVYTSGSWLY